MAQPVTPTSPKEPAPKPERKKAHHHKTRNGCMTCKIRRVKCDEARPACLRCTSTGRPCDGYMPAPPRQRRKGAKVAIASNALTVQNGPPSHRRFFSPSLPKSFSTRDTWNEKELRGFQFFQERLAKGLRPNGCAGPFWNELVPQSSESYPAVRHMAVAVASLQESFDKMHLKEDESRAPTSLALEQCNLGIHELLRSVLRTTPKEILLTTCIMLIWFELIRGNGTASSRYLEFGLDMLQKSKHDLLDILTDMKAMGWVGKPPGKLGLLESMYAKITQTGQWTGWGVELEGTDDFFDLDDFDRRLPNEYPHIVHLWTHSDILMMFCNRVLRNISNRTCIDPTAPFAIAIREKIACFTAEYFRLDGVNSSFAFPQVSSMRSILNMVTIMNVCAITANDEMLYDAHTKRFAQMVEDLKVGLIKINELVPHKGRLSVTPFSIWSIPRLYYVASNCREPSIRREAISLLMDHPRREAGLDSRTSGKIAEAKMRIEERHLGEVKTASDIPASARVRLCDARFDKVMDHVVLRYLRPPYDENTRDIENHHIAWAPKVNDLAIDDVETLNSFLQAHKLFLKASTKGTTNGVAEPMMYHGEQIKTITI